MKRSILMVILMIAGIAGLQAQKIVYDENAEVRTVENFTGIEVSGAMTVYLAQGTENAVAVSAGDAKYNSKIKTEVKNGILKISVDGGLWNGMGWTNKKLKAYVTIVSPTSIDVSGASYVSISETIKSETLKVDISGASEIRGPLDVSKLNVDISGASVARLLGTSTTAMIDASGACKFNSYDLVVENCKADASGASSIRVTVNNEFNASASGGAHIYYKGSPVKENISSSAGASVKKVSDSND